MLRAKEDSTARHKRSMRERAIEALVFKEGISFEIAAMRAGSAKDAGRLADLDQVAVRVPDVRADFASMVLRLGEELRPLRRPFLVDLVDVSDANVEKGTCAVGVERRRQSDGGLVVGGTPAYLDYQPRVPDLHH